MNRVHVEQKTCQMPQDAITIAHFTVAERAIASILRYIGLPQKGDL
jgi:hypothetical protein